MIFAEGKDDFPGPGIHPQVGLQGFHDSCFPDGRKGLRRRSRPGFRNSQPYLYAVFRHCGKETDRFMTGVQDKIQTQPDEIFQQEGVGDSRLPAAPA